MDNLLQKIVMIGLVLFVFLMVFQNGISPSIQKKGEEVESTIDTTNVNAP